MTTALSATFTGRLTAPGQARVRPIGVDGLSMPVLCLELVNESTGTPIHIEQPFPAGAMPQCQAAARRFKPGQHVTVQAPVHTLRLHVGAAEHIHINHEPPAHTQQAQSATETQAS